MTADTPKIRRDTRGKRPRFFDSDGVDELISAMLEIMAEISVLREKLYRLEAASDALGLDLAEKARTLELSPTQEAELAEARMSFLANAMRALNSEHIPRAGRKDEIDTLTSENLG